MTDDTPQIIFDDAHFMKAALRQAEMAAEEGEVPVGAVAVMNGRIIARAYNQVEKLKDATAHAEILVITQASAALGDWRLDNVDIYVTKEPCAMCSGAMVNSRIRTVIYGMPDPRSGAAGSALDVTGFKGMLHNVEAKSGILEDDCKELFQSFFKKVRKDKQGTFPAL
ncbi:MAG: tRNA-specific adenosine deaminase [Lentisphaerae bacterium GWF2_45_14]|nr:MAG: tRNA-specific adenosine deaminase [Lentisphaerae bacterium GWF2_45_14]